MGKETMKLNVSKVCYKYFIFSLQAASLSHLSAIGRSDNMRVPANKACIVKSQKQFADYSQSFAIKDWENNYNCGGKMTMTFNPYGAWSSDKVCSVFCCLNMPSLYLSPPTT
jgi:hypothetical protein